MITVNFNPVRSDDGQIESLVLTEDGTLIVNDFEYEMDDCPWVTEIADDFSWVTLRLPHGSNAPRETTFPAPVVIDTWGEVAVPPYDGIGHEDE